MLKTGEDLYLRFMEDTDVRVLHKSIVSSVSDLGPAIEIDDLDPRLEVGLELLVYYQQGDQFVQQIARIERIDPGDPRSLVQLPIDADPIAAEQRADLRAAGHGEDLVFSLDAEQCPVLDLNEIEFAVSTPRSFGAGQIVTVSFEHQGEQYSGRARVLSFSEFPDPTRFAGRCFRYGLRRELSHAAETLPAGLCALKASLYAND